MIKIILVEDQTLVRKGICGLINIIEDIEVVSESEDGEDAINKIINIPHDVVLMDIKLPKKTGIDVLKHLKNIGKQTPTILLTTFDDNELFVNGMKAGAKGFLLKDISIETLAEGIRKVAAGETLIRPGITERISNSAKQLSVDFDCSEYPGKLTKREIEILRFMAGGYSNKEISDLFCISEGVVKNHASSIFQKLGVRDRTRAVLKGLELDLI